LHGRDSLSPYDLTFAETKLILIFTFDQRKSKSKIKTAERDKKTA